MRFEHPRAHESGERMSGLEAVPTSCAIHVRSGGIPQRERTISDADPSVVVERRRRYDGVVEPQRGEVLTLRIERCSAPLHIPEADHARRR
jgi:hypothetical protein